MRNIIVLFSLIIGLSSCTDFYNDKRSYSNNEQKFKNEADSLNKLFDSVKFYDSKYQFVKLKNPDTLPENVKAKYLLWNDWIQGMKEYAQEQSEASKIDEAYFLWYISIGIGLITLRLLVYRKKIVKKWLKLVYYSSITFLFWLGTSCYAFLFIKYPTYGSQSDITFLTLSTQFKLFPFMIIWLANTIFIGLIIICLNRLFIHLFSVIVLEVKQPGYSSGKIKMDDDLRIQFQERDKTQKMKDERLKNLLLYVSSSFVLLYLYYQNQLFSKLEFVRYRIAMKSESLSNYWFLLLITILFVIYYWAEGTFLNDRKKILDEIDKNA